MPIDGLQLGSRRIGNIRLGDKSKSGAPHKLDAFRLTSDSKQLLDDAAKLYGGTVQPWTEHPGEWEVYLESKEIPFMAGEKDVEQWYELWKAGGCERRCNGTEMQPSGNACMCDPEARECKMTTYIWIRLCEIRGAGVWQLVSHGYYAAVEIPQEMRFLVELARKGRYPKCTLAIQHREKKTPGKATKKFIVPTILIPMSMDQLLGGVPVQKSLPPPPADDKTAFKAYMVDRCTQVWAEKQISPTPQNIAIACQVSPDKVTKVLFDAEGNVLWRKLLPEQLYMAVAWAETGETVAFSKTELLSIVDAIRAEWEAKRNNVPDPSSTGATDESEVVDTQTIEPDA